MGTINNALVAMDCWMSDSLWTTPNIHLQSVLPQSLDEDEHSFTSLGAVTLF